MFGRLKQISFCRCTIVALILLSGLFTQSSFAQFSHITGDLGTTPKPSVDSIGLVDYKIYYGTLVVIDKDDPEIKEAGTSVVLVGTNGLVFDDYIEYKRDSLIWNAAKWKLPATNTLNLALAYGHPLIEFSSAVIFEKNIHIFQPNLGSAVRARYEEEIPKLDWQITSEEKEIGGYKSQKATVSYRGREWTAWFTEELPIPYGSYVFGGLPGLILELRDQKGEYAFTFSGMEKSTPEDTPLMLSHSKQLRVLPRDQVRVMVKNYMSNPVAAMGNRVKMKDGSSIPKKSFPYNPIELE